MSKLLLKGTHKTAMALPLCVLAHGGSGFLIGGMIPAGMNTIGVMPRKAVTAVFVNTYHVVVFVRMVVVVVPQCIPRQHLDRHQPHLQAHHLRLHHALSFQARSQHPLGGTVAALSVVVLWAPVMQPGVVATTARLRTSSLLMLVVSCLVLHLLVLASVVGLVAASVILVAYTVAVHSLILVKASVATTMACHVPTVLA